MTNVIPIHAHKRIEEVRTPRTTREAWGADTELEKLTPIRPLWKDWAAGVALIVLFAMIFFVAGLAQSIWMSSHAAQRSAVTMECDAEGGHCQ